MRTRMLAVAGMWLAGCGISREQYAAREAELVKYQEMYGDATAKATILEGEVAELNGQVTLTEARLQAVQEEKAAARARAPSPAIGQAQRERLAQALQRQIRAGQVEISELRGALTVRLKDRLLFAPGSATLGRDGRSALDALAEALKGQRDLAVAVAGHTDSGAVAKQGPFKDNWDLSCARAVAVVRHLASRGLAPSTLGAAGQAQYRPLGPNDSPAGRSLNRRIEITLTPAPDLPAAPEAPRR